MTPITTTKLDLEIQQQRARDFVESTLKHARVLIDPDSSPENWERQAGRGLTSEEFEGKLRKLLPSLVFEVIEGNPFQRKRIILPIPGQEIHLGVMENRPAPAKMPEFSVWDSIEEELPDPDYIGTGKTASRVDYTPEWTGELEFDEELGETRGEAYRFKEGSARPGLLKIRRPYHEIIRGWRTVLARLVQEGVLTINQVEREFGGCDRATWAANAKRSLDMEVPFG